MYTAESIMHTEKAEKRENLCLNEKVFRSYFFFVISFVECDVFVTKNVILMACAERLVNVRRKFTSKYFSEHFLSLNLDSLLLNLT